ERVALEARFERPRAGAAGRLGGVGEPDVPAAVRVTRRTRRHGRPCSEAYVLAGRIALDELVPRLGYDDRLGGRAGVILRDDVRDELVSPLAVADPALVVVEPGFIVEDAAGGPLRGVGAAL